MGDKAPDFGFIPGFCVEYEDLSTTNTSYSM